MPEANKGLNNKLTKTLGFFSIYELNKLVKWVKSPYFNENKVLMSLMELYVEQFRRHKNILLTKIQVWESLFPNEAFDDLKFRRLNSDLLQLTIEFIGRLHTEAHPFDGFKQVVNGVYARRIEPLYSTVLKHLKLAEKKEQGRSSDYYQMLYEFYSATSAKEFRREPNNFFKGIMSSLDQFYLIEKLKYHCFYLNFQKALKIPYEPVLVNEIIRHMGETPYKENPVLRCYYTLYLTFIDEENEAHYHELKKLLISNIQFFSSFEYRNLFQILLNYCIRQTNRNKAGFYIELFELYGEMLDSGILLLDGVLQHTAYKNIVSVALKLGKFEWTECFIRDYDDFLAPGHRDNSRIYNQAKLHFYRREYQDVVALLGRVEYKDVFYLLGSKGLLLRTYFELGEISAMYSLMDSFRVLLNRRKLVSETHRKIYLNAIRFLRKLQSHRKNPDKLKKVKAELQDTAHVADLSWLLEKTNELIGKNG